MFKSRLSPLQWLSHLIGTESNMKIFLENPKPPFQLFRVSKDDINKYESVLTKSGKQIWACGECGTLQAYQYNQADPNDQKTRAENCCKIPKCECGKNIETNYYIKCDECRSQEKDNRDQKRLNEAEEVQSTDSWIYCEGYGHNEGYFESVDALLEWIEDNEDEESYPIPKYVHICSKIKFNGLDMTDVLTNELDSDFHEDAIEQLDIEPLQKMVDQWSAKQSLHSWQPDYKKKIKVK